MSKKHNNSEPPSYYNNSNESSYQKAIGTKESAIAVDIKRDDEKWRRIKIKTVYSGIKNMGELVFDIISGNLVDNFKKEKRYKHMSVKRKKEFLIYKTTLIKNKYEKTFADFLYICAKEKVIVSPEIAKEFRSSISKLPNLPITQYTKK